MCWVRGLCRRVWLPLRVSGRLGVWSRFVLRRRVGWRLLPFGSMLFLSASDGASLSFAPDLVQILPLRCSLVAFLLTYKLMVAEVDHLRW